MRGGVIIAVGILTGSLVVGAYDYFRGPVELSSAPAKPIVIQSKPLAAILLTMCNKDRYAAVVATDGTITMQPWSPDVTTQLRKDIPSEHAIMIGPEGCEAPGKPAAPAPRAAQPRCSNCTNL